MSIKQWAEGGGEEGWRTDVGQAQLQVVKPPTDRSLHAHHVKKRADKLIGQRRAMWEGEGRQTDAAALALQQTKRTLSPFSP